MRQKTSAELGAEQVEIKIGKANPIATKSIKQQVLLAFYIAVGNLPDSDVKEYVTKVSNQMNLSKEFNDVTCFYIPVRKGETRIERIYTGDRNFKEIEEIQKQFGKITSKTKRHLNTDSNGRVYV